MGLPFTHQNYGLFESVNPFTAKTEFIKAHESTGERHRALAASLHCVLKPARHPIRFIRYKLGPRQLTKLTGRQ